MTDLLIWGGPVYGPGQAPKASGDVGKVVFGRPTKILTVSGNGSSYFANLAAKWKDANGRILPNLLAQHGLRRQDFDKVAIAGFSAFHGLAAPLLLADGDLIDAAVLLDSCFGAKGAPHKEGYVQFAARAARGERLMVFTSSSGQNSTAQGLPPSTTGSECALHNATMGADQAGLRMEPFVVPEPLPEPKSGPAVRAGNLFVVDYHDDYFHGDLVNTLGRDTLQVFLVPYLMGEAGHGLLVSPAEVALRARRWQIAGAVLALAAAAGLGIAVASRRAA